MIGEKILEKKVVTLVEVKDLLKENKKMKDLNYEQEAAYNYAKTFSKLTRTKADKLLKDLKAIDGVSEEFAVKIVDIMPMEKEILKILIPKESEFKEDTLDTILETVKKYGGKDISDRAKDSAAAAKKTAKKLKQKAKEEEEKRKKEAEEKAKQEAEENASDKK